MHSDCYGSTAGAKAGTVSSGSKFPHRDLNKLVWDRAEYKMKLFSVVLAVRGFAVCQDSTWKGLQWKGFGERNALFPAAAIDLNYEVFQTLVGVKSSICFCPTTKQKKGIRPFKCLSDFLHEKKLEPQFINDCVLALNTWNCIKARQSAHCVYIAPQHRGYKTRQDGRRAVNMKKRRRLCFWKLSIKWQQVYPDWRDKPYSHLRNKNGSRDSHRGTGSGMKVNTKIWRGTGTGIRQQPAWTWIKGCRRAAVWWLTACPQPCCHEKDTYTVTKKRKRKWKKKNNSKDTGSVTLRL